MDRIIAIATIRVLRRIGGGGVMDNRKNTVRQMIARYGRRNSMQLVGYLLLRFRSRHSLTARKSRVKYMK